MIDQGPIFTRPIAVLQSTNRMWSPEISWNHCSSPQTDTQEVVWGGVREPPLLPPFSYLHKLDYACKHLRQNLQLESTTQRSGDHVWGVICIEIGESREGEVQAGWRHLEKHGSLVGRHGLVWLVELWEFPAQLVKGLVWNGRSTYNVVVAQKKTYLNFHEI